MNDICEGNFKMILRSLAWVAVYIAPITTAINIAIKIVPSTIIENSGSSAGFKENGEFSFWTC